MKIAFKIKAKNGALQEFIDKRGWTQSDFAREVGVSPQTIGRIFNMNHYPGKIVSEKICRLICRLEEDIFPSLLKHEDFIDLRKEITFYKKVDPDRILNGRGLLEIEAPVDDSVEYEELVDTVNEVLDTLSYRAREIIKMRHGMTFGNTENSYKAIGKKFCITTERARQLYMRAIRQIRHPIRSMKLEVFLPEQPTEKV